MPPLAQQTFEADLYAAALNVALDPGADPAARAGADAFMRALADEMREPGEDGHRYSHRTPADDIVAAAIDQRIYGPAHHQ